MFREHVFEQRVNRLEKRRTHSTKFINTSEDAPRYGTLTIALGIAVRRKRRSGEEISRFKFTKFLRATLSHKLFRKLSLHRKCSGKEFVEFSLVLEFLRFPETPAILET